MDHWKIILCIITFGLARHFSSFIESDLMKSSIGIILLIVGLFLWIISKKIEKEKMVKNQSNKRNSISTKKTNYIQINDDDQTRIYK